MLNGPLWLGRERHGCRVDPATLLPPKNRGLPRDLQWSGYGLHKGRGWLMDACFGGTWFATRDPKITSIVNCFCQIETATIFGHVATICIFVDSIWYDQKRRNIEYLNSPKAYQLIETRILYRDELYRYYIYIRAPRVFRAPQICMICKIGLSSWYYYCNCQFAFVYYNMLHERLDCLLSLKQFMGLDQHPTDLSLCTKFLKGY